jgi:hypothetical protein
MYRFMAASLIADVHLGRENLLRPEPGRHTGKFRPLNVFRLLVHGRCEQMDMADTDFYVVRTARLSRQLADRHKLAFFGVVYALLLLSLVMIGHHVVWRGATIGAFVGTLPSFRFGLVASMRIRGASDWARAEHFLRTQAHRRDNGVWVPDLPRLMYFDAQAVGYENGAIHGPVGTLKRLRRVLLDSGVSMTAGSGPMGG